MYISKPFDIKYQIEFLLIHLLNCNKNDNLITVHVQWVFYYWFCWFYWYQEAEANDIEIYMKNLARIRLSIAWMLCEYLF